MIHNRYQYTKFGCRCDICKKAERDYKRQLRRRNWEQYLKYQLTYHQARPEYTAFLGARNRCNNPNYKQYQYYGGRGIKFLFKDFQEFINHIGLKNDPTLSLDRIDNNGNYEPGNIRWTTKSVQQRNRRKKG